MQGRNKMYQASLYFNYPAFKDVIFIVIENDYVPDKIVQKGDFVGLYYLDKLIGVNVFNSHNYLKLKISGQLKTTNQPLNKLISSLIKSYLNEDIILVDSPIYLGKIIENQNGKYLVNINKQTVIANSYLNLSINSKYVLLTYKDSFLDNGQRAYKYLDSGVDYLIIGYEDEVFDDNVIGTSFYSITNK